ncbi:MAG: hypothetical protein HUU30_17120 [Burkholderiaceae bacterium]|nr:hypothetical protein [Burkholderiaceae bacterium]
MNTNETERPDTYDRACRDADDNCPTENAVLRREWRQKTATIAVLATTLEQQTARFELLRAAAAALLDDMGEPDDGVEANLMQALRDAMA